MAHVFYIQYTCSLSLQAFKVIEMHVMSTLSNFHIQSSAMVSKTKSLLRKRKNKIKSLLSLGCDKICFFLCIALLQYDIKHILNKLQRVHLTFISNSEHWGTQ
jgi:hypothetical protein